jgi:tetratricopeptide (TPR) repeat protein
MKPAYLLGAAAIIAIAGTAWWFGSDHEPATPPAPAFAGSAACASCHASEHAAWSGSQHALAMQQATDATVLGQFDETPFEAGGVMSRFFRRDGKFFVNTDGADGAPADFEVPYAFGVYPLQQYLVPLPGGRLQALGIAWDARPADAGGQRWFHLYPDQTLKAGNPLHWTGIDQNWNYQCADCHSTNVRKNYDPATASFSTAWSEISVGCEGCHGPASNHLLWARRESGWRALDGAKGLVNALDERRGVNWLQAASGTATRSTPRTGSREIDTCARCHARRGQFTDAIHAGEPWLDGFRPALLEPGLYHADGQQRDEVYTWGSFLQSRMHAAGVTCADCHEPHSGKLRAAGNAVCSQCHEPAKFDTTAHHQHNASAGSECVACHMPATTYMIVDPRHDHSLRIPRPDRTLALGTPNACAACHADRGAQWAADAIAAWYPQRKPGFQAFAETFAAADRGEPVASALIGVLGDAAQPALVRASALARLRAFPSDESLAAISAVLQDGDALLRATAAEALGDAQPGVRAERLAPLLRDSAHAVRMAAARALAGEPEGRLLADERTSFEAALAEWTAAQQFNADRPESLTNLGTMSIERGRPDDAMTRFRQAIALDPTFVQAAVNLADTQRAIGDETGAEATLRQALDRDPQSAAVHHALGLALVRQQRATEAVAALKKAAALAPESARYAFVYAVALHDTGQRAEALSVLRAAMARHPHDRELRDALTTFEAASTEPARQRPQS